MSCVFSAPLAEFFQRQFFRSIGFIPLGNITELCYKPNILIQIFDVVLFCHRDILT